jgi:hypothetical protein
MGRLIRPLLFSEYFRLPRLHLEERGLLDPILNADTKLFIDPLLLRDSKNEIIKAHGLPLLRKRFTDIMRLTMASKALGDVAWRTAQRLMDLGGRREICLGFGGSSVSGSSRPDNLKNGILQTTKEIMELGVDDPEIISLMAFLEDGVGPDTISDLTTNAIFPALQEITEKICRDRDLPLEKFVVDGREMMLPGNPFSHGRNGIALVPLDILRELPIATDWSEVAHVAFKNKHIRDRVNALIADFAKATVREKKAALKKAALQSKRAFWELFDGLLNADRAYDVDQDQAGIQSFRRALREVAARYPLRIVQPTVKTCRVGAHSAINHCAVSKSN